MKALSSTARLLSVTTGAWLLLGLASCDDDKAKPPEKVQQATAPAAIFDATTADVAKPVRKLKLTLNSTPSDAMVVVNGNEVGKTPMILEVEDHGKPIEFVYKLPGYQNVTKKELLVRDGEVHGVFGKKLK